MEAHLAAIRASAGMASQLQLATRAPFVNHSDDPASHVAEALYDSGPLADVLKELAFGVDPHRPFVVSLVEAEREVRKLADMRASWIAYCDERFSLDPSATDANSEMSRQYVFGDAVRAWPRFDEAQAVIAPATEALRTRGPERSSSSFGPTRCGLVGPSMGANRKCARSAPS